MEAPWETYVSFHESCLIWDGKRWIMQPFMKMDCGSMSSITDAEIIQLQLSAGPMHQYDVWVNGRELRERMPEYIKSWFYDRVLVSFTLPDEGHQLTLTHLLNSNNFVPIYGSEEEAREAARRS